MHRNRLVIAASIVLTVFAIVWPRLNSCVVRLHISPYDLIAKAIVLAGIILAPIASLMAMNMAMETVGHRWRVAVGAHWLIVVAFVFWRAIRSPETYESVRHLGAPVVEQLQGFNSQHGVFPSTLEGSGIQLPRTCYGRFLYTPTGDLHSYRLTLGEYAIDGFTVGWQDGHWIGASE